MLKNIEVSILIHQYSDLQLRKMVFTAQYTQFKTQITFYI